MPNILKRGLQYFSITTKLFKFNDTLNYSSPCNYSKYLKQWKVKEIGKSIFPYQLYSTVEELSAATEFPSRESFYSTLTKKEVSVEEYESAKKEYDGKKSLPDDNPNKMRSMLCWLRHYNLLDVGPLVKAMSNCFEAFFSNFGMDASQYLSLPTIACNALYKSYDQQCSYIHTFPNEWNHIRQLHRDNIIGGLVSCFHRYINLVDDSGPKNGRYAPNGDRFTHLIQLDFNSLYGCMQRKQLPTTPGVLWTRYTKTRLKKSVMCTDASLKAMQWLFYEQTTDESLKKRDGTKLIIHHKYHHGEKRIDGDLVDGYLQMEDGTIHIYEFLGCYYHGGCCKRIKNELQTIQRWTDKKQRLEKHGKLHVMRECEWDSIHQAIGSVPTRFPRIMKSIDTDEALLKGIQDGSLYGFIQCDVWCDDALVNKLKGLNFPPVFNKIHMSYDLLSPFMLKRYHEEGRKLDQMSIVQTFRGKQLLLLSELAKFYLDLGMELRNITLFTQYLGEHCFAPFIDKVTKMRIEATYEGDETKSNTAKIMGNAVFGKTLQNNAKNTTTKIISEDKLGKYLRKNTLKGYHVLETEVGPTANLEVTLRKQKIVDNHPVHVGNAILQHSKLHFLTYVIT